MLLETVDTLLAFITVILVLSLVVTGLVQVAQYALRLRGRVLERGLASLLATVCEGDEDVDPQALARRVASDERLVQAPGKLLPWLAGTWKFFDRFRFRTSWIEPGELREILRDDLGYQRLAEVEKWFQRMEDNQSKRFQHRVRWITLALALIVAGVTQVDTPGLLRRLSTDAELRGKLVAAATEARAVAERTLTDELSYEQVAEEALERLQGRHPELTEVLEEASGTGRDRAEIVAELELVLAERTDVRPAILAEYEELLDELYEQGYRRSRQRLDEALDLGARIGLSVWPQGGAFYWGSRGPEWGRCLGVLLTAILVSFGAPFWFEQLKRVAALRDRLAKRKEEK